MFDKILEFTMKWETGGRKDGGYTKDPDDPGGETKWGISKKAHPDVDIKNLTYEDAKLLYKNDYWDRLSCDSFDGKLAAAVFDTSVNIGVQRTRRFLEKTKDPEELLDLRYEYYQLLIAKNGKLLKYFTGWNNRINALRKFLTSF